MRTNSYPHVQALAGEIGCRRIGTAGNAAAAQYISDAFQAAGCMVELQPFDCPSWEPQSTRLTVGGKPVKAYANTFSPPGSIHAPVLPISSLEEAECADLQGKLVVLYGAAVQNPLSPKAFFYASERDLKLIALMENAPAAGVITVNPTLGARYRLIEDPDFTLPSATVPLGIGLELVQQAGQSAHLSIKTRCEPGQTANVIGRMRGERSDRRMVICAHYDTKEDTPGALDNAGGTAVLLALAEIFARRPRPCDLEFTAFTCEEYYTSPDRDVYFQQNGSTFGEIIAAINIDGAGNGLSTNTLTTLAAAPELDALVDEARAKYPGMLRVDPWVASNHYLFFANGVPSLAFSSVIPNGLMHTPNDAIAWIHPEKLDEVVACITGMIDRLAEQAPAWARPSGA